MKPMTGPWYTIEDTLEILGLRANELHYAIDTGSITGCLYTAPINLLAFTVVNDQKVGHATLKYQGHVFVAKQHLYTIFEEGKLNTSPIMAPLEIDKITDWNKNYPYETATPNEVLFSWNPISFSELTSDFLYFHLPTEKIDYFKYFGDVTLPLIKEISENFHEDMDCSAKFKENKAYLFDWYNNKTWHKSNIRFAKSEIDKYLNPKSLAPIKPSSPKIKKRENQLHTVIERVIGNNPKLSTKEIWKAIQDDYDSDNPIFDSENIIQKMDTSCIDWKSRKGAERSIKWSSFESTVSKIKKEIS